MLLSILNRTKIGKIAKTAKETVKTGHLYGQTGYSTSTVDLNLTTFFGAILTGAPERGLRPIRTERWITEKDTKPEMVTRSVSLRVLITISTYESTDFFTATLDSPVSKATASTSCVLFITRFRVNGIQAQIYALILLFGNTYGRIQVVCRMIRYINRTKIW